MNSNNESKRRQKNYTEVFSWGDDSSGQLGLAKPVG